MIENFGIGIDIVDINRFRDTPYKEKITFYKKIFNKKEIEYCLQFNDPYPHFAGKFAIKEATLKAIKEKIQLLDIEILHVKSKPNVKIKKSKKKYQFQVSVSHEKKIAVAVVISFEENKLKV